MRLRGADIRASSLFPDAITGSTVGSRSMQQRSDERDAVRHVETPIYRGRYAIHHPRSGT
jgi:hypothetical protein